MSSILKVDTIQDTAGNNIINESSDTITIGASGDTVNVVGTLQNNGAAIPGDISSVVAGTGLSGGGTSGAVTLNVEAAQSGITSLGTITTFRSTGIDDNADALAMTIDSSENVLVGKTSDTFANVGVVLSNSQSNAFVSDGRNVIAIRRNSDDGDLIKLYKDATNVGNIGNIGTSGLVMGSGNIGLFFDSSAGEQSVKPRNSDGSARDNAIDLGRAAHRWRDIYLGGGAFLGGTGTANKLEDYEEGTWSPAINGSTITTGFYTKVGRMCVATFGDATSNIPELTNGSDFLITGLPFGQIGSGWTYGSTPTASYADASASYHSYPLTGRQRNDSHIYIVNRSGQTKAANDPLNLCIVYQTN